MLFQYNVAKNGVVLSSTFCVSCGFSSTGCCGSSAFSGFLSVNKLLATYKVFSLYVTLYQTYPFTLLLDVAVTVSSVPAPIDVAALSVDQLALKFISFDAYIVLFVSLIIRSISLLKGVI